MAEPIIFNHPRPKKSVLPPLSKKRKTEHKIEEISFDSVKREDFLTGFHKRKVARTKQAQAEAEKKAREEKVQLRKTLREERKKELEDHVHAVNALLSEPRIPEQEESDEDVWGGIEDDKEPELVDHEEEYVDEDRYTTVTVEAVDISKNGIQSIADEGSEPEEKEVKPVVKEEDTKKKWPKKERKQKFRYESKAERRISRGKQKAGNKTKAEARRGQ